MENQDPVGLRVNFLQYFWLWKAIQSIVRNGQMIRIESMANEKPGTREWVSGSVSIVNKLGPRGKSGPGGAQGKLPTIFLVIKSYTKYWKKRSERFELDPWQMKSPEPWIEHWIGSVSIVNKLGPHGKSGSGGAQGKLPTIFLIMKSYTKYWKKRSERFELNPWQLKSPEPWSEFQDPVGLRVNFLQYF